MSDLRPRRNGSSDFICDSDSPTILSVNSLDDLYLGGSPNSSGLMKHVSGPMRPEISPLSMNSGAYNQPREMSVSGMNSLGSISLNTLESTSSKGEPDADVRTTGDGDAAASANSSSSDINLRSFLSAPELFYTEGRPFVHNEKLTFHVNMHSDEILHGVEDVLATFIGVNHEFNARNFAWRCFCSHAGEPFFFSILVYKDVGFSMMTTQKTNKNDKCDDDVERPRHLIEMRLLNSKVFVADFRNYFYQMRSAMCTLNKAYNECEGDKQEPSWDDMIDVSGVASDMNVGIPLGGSSSSGACAHTSSITMVDADVSANDTCVPAVSPLSEAEHHDILRKVVDECLRSSPEQRQFHLQILNMQVSEDSVLVHRFMCETGCVGVCLEELRKDESVVNCQMATNILVRLSMIPFGADAIMASDFACLVKHAKDQPFDRCEIARDCAMIMANIIRRSSGQVMKYLGDSLKAWLESEVTLNDRTLAMRIRGCSHQLGISSGALSPVAKTTKLVFTETAAGAS